MKEVQVFDRVATRWLFDWEQRLHRNVAPWVAPDRCDAVELDDPERAELLPNRDQGAIASRDVLPLLVCVFEVLLPLERKPRADKGRKHGGQRREDIARFDLHASP